MKISIAMATYNGAQYLNAQLQSLVDQTRHPDELIITDDCSVDETETIILEFAKTAPFLVRFYRNERNLGYCDNFNAALMKTSGDLVFLSDQDDVWFREKIEVISEVLSETSALVLMNDAVITDGSLNPRGITKYQKIKKMGLKDESFVMGCCCAFKREFLRWALPIPMDYPGHDNWLVGLADKLNSKVIVDQPLQFYRRHEENTSKIPLNDKNFSKLSFTIYSFGKRTIKWLAPTSPSYLKLENALKNALDEIEALEQGKHIAEGSCVRKYEVAIDNLTHRVQHLRERLVIIEKIFIFRVFFATRYLLSGGYRSSQGFLSAFKDIFRKGFKG